MKARKLIKILGWAAAIAALLIIVGIVALRSTFLKSFPALEGTPEVGKWYEVQFDDAICAHGDPWFGLFRKGTENKVLIEFFGGGVSLDPYTAARGNSLVEKGGYYADNAKNQDFIATFGIGGQQEDNPFKDWTLIVLPYATGDFHCGTNDYPYIGLDGEQHILHHHGYTNYSMLLERLLPYLGTPDELVITGSSAGGWATSILADDVIGHFPGTKNVTVFVDSSFLYYDKWKDTARDIWGAPSAIVERVVSENIVLDCLTALRKDHPEVKILFDCSVRDNALANYQAYIDKGDNSVTTRADGDVFQKNLQKMVVGLQEQVPGCGIFLWDDVWDNEKEALTMHTILISHHFFTDRAGNGSICGWLTDAIGGNVYSRGLELIDKEY